MNHQIPRHNVPASSLISPSRISCKALSGILLPIAFMVYSGSATAEAITYATKASPQILMQTSNNRASDALPNAYELVKKFEKQQAEMARLAGQVETLQLEIMALKNKIATDTIATDTTDPSLNDSVSANSAMSDSRLALKNQLKNELTEELIQVIHDEIARHNIPSSKKNVTGLPRQPYLTPPNLSDTDSHSDGSPIILTNLDIPRPSFNTSANNLASNNESMPISSTYQKQGEQAYADAYAALKDEGAEAGIQKMNTFIATYAKHDLIPNAHYWLGEFYLKENPPNLVMAKEQFVKVATLYKDDPNNNKQSKALYRLATFAQGKGNSAQAKQYIDELLTEYPNSAEATLAKQTKW